MADEFAQLQRELAVGQAEIARRERVQQAVINATLAKSAAAARDTAESAQLGRQFDALIKAAPALLAAVETLAQQINPQHALRAKAAQAGEAMTKALADGHYDIAMKLEIWRNRFLAQLA